VSKVTISVADWNAEGERRFGPDRFKWRFRCPICAHVASPEDFRKFKNAGANPNSATQECIGRYLPKNKCLAAFGENADSSVKQPCDYAGYGLIRVSPVEVESPDGTKSECFAFAD
jgi:hypothetical protein